MSLYKLFRVVLPSMLIGGLVFGSALGYAHDGRDNIIAHGGDTSGDRAARRAPRPRTAQVPSTPPTPPVPPKAPKAPKPPKPPGAPPPGGWGQGHGQGHGKGSGISINVNGNKIDISGIDGLVKGQLDGVREMVRNNPHIPPPLRDKILARIDKVKASVDKRLAKIRSKGIEHMGEELEKMGEEIEEAMEGLDDELEQLGEQLGKDLSKKFKNKKFKFDIDDDDDDDDDDDIADSVPMTPDLDDVDAGDMGDAIDDLKGMSIRPQQKEAIAKIRAQSDSEVAAARKHIESLSKQLERALSDPKTPDAEIRKHIDSISAQEATIRKSRIIAWHNARRILDENQRKRIEAAAKKRNR